MRRCVRGAIPGERSARNHACLRSRGQWKLLSEYLQSEIALTVLFVM
jgi:hypothetical protein